MDGVFLGFAGKSELRKGIACDKVFKNGPSKICGRQPLKKILLGPFLNTLLHIQNNLWYNKLCIHLNYC